MLSSPKILNDVARVCYILSLLELNSNFIKQGFLNDLRTLVFYFDRFISSIMPYYIFFIFVNVKLNQKIIIINIIIIT